MKRLCFPLLALSSLLCPSATVPGKPDGPIDRDGPISRDEAAANDEPITRADLAREVAAKVERVRGFLREQKLGGVLLTQVRNFAWMTAGLGRNDVVLTSEVGAASLLIMEDGKKYLVASNSEVPRLMSEDLKGLGFEAKEYRWYEDKAAPDRKLEIIRDLAAGREIGTDAPYGGLRLVDRELAPLRYELTEAEIAKYRWLGRNTTEAVVSVCRRLRPGMTELDLERMASDELLRRGIRPTVLLMGVDERQFAFRHPTPTEARLEKYAFVNVCARKWGLIVSIGRFVHFGPLPEELRARLRASATVSARLQARSRPGTKVSDLMELAKRSYAEQGFEGEWREHHLGGAIGYVEREWVAFPGSPEVIRERQALAWNPFVKSALSFDMIIAYRDRFENITETPDWPTVVVTVEGKESRMPDILVR